MSSAGPTAALRTFGPWIGKQLPRRRPGVVGQQQPTGHLVRGRRALGRSPDLVQPGGQRQRGDAGTGTSSAPTATVALPSRRRRQMCCRLRRRLQARPRDDIAGGHAGPCDRRACDVRLSPYTPTPTRQAQYPNVALPVPDGSQSLDPGQRTWYAFTYAGDRSPIQLQMHADPPGSANFTVWSWDVLQRWGERYFYTPTGRGTPNDVYGGDLFWTGGSIIRGTWYVVVEQSGASPSNYTLKVSGNGVDRTLPPTAVPTPTYSAPSPHAELLERSQGET